MQEPATHDRYDRVSLVLHWIAALAVLVAFVLGPGDYGDFVEGGGDPGTRLDILWHESLGMLVFVLTVVRLLWLAVRPQPPVVEMPGWMRRLAGVVKGVLWVLMLALPVTALLTLGSESFPLTLLGHIRVDTIPGVAGSSLAGWTDWGELHTLLGDAMIWLAGLHGAAAVFHHLVLKDKVLKSMLP